MFVDNIEVFIL